jgi:hypothetical protein
VQAELQDIRARFAELQERIGAARSSPPR